MNKALFMKYLAATIILSSLTVSAQSEKSIAQRCQAKAIATALKDAKDNRSYTNITVSNIQILDVKKTTGIIQYEVSLKQWDGDDSFGLTYEVKLTAQKRFCVVDNLELTNEE